MLLKINIKDERFRKGYRQVTKEFKTYSDLKVFLQNNKDRVYGKLKKYTILDKGKIQIDVLK